MNLERDIILLFAKELTSILGVPVEWDQIIYKSQTQKEKVYGDVKVRVIPDVSNQTQVLHNGDEVDHQNHQ
jgi:hypothetical protein